MENPFLKRATEHVRDDEAFLAIVSHVPVSSYLVPSASQGVLYDRLVTILGTPGSGKTTLARLFEFRTVDALLRHGEASHRELASVLRACQVLGDSGPRVTGCRLPMETDYRDIWEFPYPAELKAGLTSALIQARAVLGWLRTFEDLGIPLDQVRVVPRGDALAAKEAVGGEDAVAVKVMARRIEQAVYEITASLVPPDVSALRNHEAVRPYRPFDVIESFEVPVSRGGHPESLTLLPLVILDDAHTLHPDQLRAVQSWLRRRELRVARWLLMRLDLLTPAEVFEVGEGMAGYVDDAANPMATRDLHQISLQSIGADRRDQRKMFRRMAEDMANRYLRNWALFADRDLRRLSDLLQREVESISPGKLRHLEEQVSDAQHQLSIADDRRGMFAADVRKYAEGKAEVTPDVELAMTRILMHRYANRVPQSELFGLSDPDPPKPVAVGSDVLDGARVHLLHQYDRPYYVGLETLADASSENAEQFLQLASRIVDVAATRITLSRPVRLSGRDQHVQLRKRAVQLVDGWNFPLHVQVRALADAIGDRCLKKSLEPNAPLGGGANAFGLLQEDFGRVAQAYPTLAKVLHYGLAHNVFSMVQNYSCKNRMWCLLELGGLMVLKHGLTLRRGGFVEGTSLELNQVITDSVR